MEINRLFRFELEDTPVIVSPLVDLGDLECDRIERAGTKVLNRQAATSAKDVVVDLEKTALLGSTSLGLFVRLGSQAAERGGQMAVCNASLLEREVIRGMRLDTVWLVCDTREEALDAVHRNPPESVE